MLVTEDIYLAAFGLVSGGELVDVHVRGTNGRRMAFFFKPFFAGNYRVRRRNTLCNDFYTPDSLFIGTAYRKRANASPYRETYTDYITGAALFLLGSVFFRGPDGAEPFFHSCACAIIL